MVSSAKTSEHDQQDDAYLTVRDPRTNRNYRIPVNAGAIRASSLSQITMGDKPAVALLSYDPALVNTASCRSAITYIDGDAGVLRYRGYAIEDLAGRTSFLDIAYLLLFGELPTPEQSVSWASRVSASSRMPREILALISTFPSASHPMVVLQAAWSGLSAYRDASRAADDERIRERETPACLGLIATLVAAIIRHAAGHETHVTELAQPYAAGILREVFPNRAEMTDPVFVRALDTLLTLQADHEQNCSTNAVRAVGSSRVDPYSAISAGLAALYGPLHGGANEAVVRMLHDIGSTRNVVAYVDSVKRGERKLMGFGHRIYRSYDPRAKIIKRTATEVFEKTGTNPLLEVALEVERIALADDYFVSRRLYPNVDFYTGLIYEAMGLPTDTYTALFAIARMAGWVAQWQEMVTDPEQKITRPRQLYVGPASRPAP